MNCVVALCRRNVDGELLFRKKMKRLFVGKDGGKLASGASTDKEWMRRVLAMCAYAEGAATEDSTIEDGSNMNGASLSSFQRHSVPGPYTSE